MLCFQATAVSNSSGAILLFYNYSSHFHINWLKIISNNKPMSVAALKSHSQSNICVILVAA